MKSYYFSEAVFSVAAPEDWRTLSQLRSSVDAQHKALWTLFRGIERGKRPYIYHHRVEGSSGPKQSAHFWMISSERPISADPRWTLRTKSYAPKFRVGQRLGFELRMSPAVSRVDPEAPVPAGRRVPRSKRHDPVAVAIAQAKLEKRSAAQERQLWISHKLVEWLAARSSSKGFELPRLERVQVSRYEPVVEQRQSGGDLKFSIADFRGELVVTDPERFAHAALDGIGHQRGFGCGMFLLRSAKSHHGAAEEEE
jgi:CRISPR system Cascade subunit CasE